MRLASMAISNYLSFGEDGCEVQFEGCTGLVGENNAGKSNLMRAVRLLCEGRAATIGRTSFYREKAERPIEVAGVFVGLTAREKAELTPWLCGDELKLRRQFELAEDGEEDDEEKAETSIWCVVRRPKEEWLDHDAINMEVVKKMSGEAQQLVIGDTCFADKVANPDKPTVKAWKDAAAWFRAHRAEAIEWRDEEKPNPKGLRQVLQHWLPEVIHVQAVRELADEAKVLKTNPFGRIVARLVSSIPEEDRGVMQAGLAEPLARLNREAGEQRLPSFGTLDQELNKRLREHMECDLDVRVEPPDMESLIRDCVRLYADDGGHVTDVAHKGHGLQRAVIFALFRAYADREQIFGAGAGSERSCVFLIEEPELYLHPHLQRASFGTLRRLGESRDQVVYSTHSPLFVDASLFDLIRIVRSDGGAGERRTRVSDLPMQALVDDALARGDDACTPEAIREEYANACDVRHGEGLFAKRVLVVEGQSEEAALPLYAEAVLGHSLDRDSVSVVCSGGVGGVPRLCRVYGGLGVPFYPLVDWHGGTTEVSVRQVADLFGQALPEAPCTQIGPEWGVLEEKWEAQCEAEIPGYAELVAAAQATTQCDSKPVIARCIARELVRRGAGEGNPASYVPQFVREIIERGTACELHPGVLKT